MIPFLSIGFVFQFSSLLPTLRAVDNVAMPALLGKNPDPAAAYSRAEVLLAQVGLADRLDAYPSELSGGEQRRAAIARASINSPPLLLADEPTGDLDEETEAEIMALLLQLCRVEGKTLVMVTHNLALAQAADCVLNIKQGMLVI
ncbi:MAG: ABC transporter ATP-binding protein [Microcystaceae cyanobacterium]